MEKLLFQIFERKKWIVNQAKHQAYLFEEHLASKCLIDGIAPPHWLLSSSSSDPNHVLKKQELISGVPLPGTQLAIPFSGSHCSLFDRPIPTAQNERLPNGLCTELYGSERGFGAADKVPVSPECPVSKAGHASNSVSQGQREEDPSVTSPEDQRDARITDIYHDPAPSLARGAGDEVSILSQGPITNVRCSTYGVPQDQGEEERSVTSPEDRRDARTSDIYHDPALSLARVQRSKSRQKALAIRNSATKSCSQDKNNANVLSGGTLGRAISSLQPDPVDELKLVEPVGTSDNTCEVEEAKIGEFQIMEKGIAMSSGTMARSRGSGQQKSSLNVSGSACITRIDWGTLTDSICITPQQPNHVNQPLELVNYSHITNGSFQEKEGKVGDHFSKEKGSSIYSGRTTRSRSASQQPNCFHELLESEHLCRSIKEDGGRSLIKQPTLVDEMVEVVKSFDNVDGSCELKTILGECSSKEHATSGYCGRITRSRSSSQPQFNNSFSKLDASCVLVKGGSGTLQHSTGKSTQSRQPVNWNEGDPDLHDAHGPQVSILRSPPAQDNQIFCAENGRKHSSKASSSEEHVYRSSGSQAVHSIEIIKKDVSSNISLQQTNQLTSAASDKSHDAQRTRMPAGRSSPFQSDQDLGAVNSTDSDQCGGRNTCEETTGEISKSPNSQALAHKGTQSNSAAPNKHLAEKLAMSSTMEKEVLQTSDFVEREVVAESQVGPDGSVEANPILSVSNLDGTGHRVGVEVLVSRQPADCSVFVNHKQLYFDDAEESCLNGFSIAALEKGMQGRSSRKRSPSLMHFEDKLDDTTVDNQENCNSPLEMNFLGDPEASIKGKELMSCLSEVPSELYKSRSASDGNVTSPVKEISDTHEDAIANTLLESAKVQKSSLIDCPTGLQKAPESSVESLVKEVMGSNVNSVKSTDLVSEVSALGSHGVENPIVSRDSDFFIMSKPGSSKIPDAKNLTCENPCAWSLVEMKGNLRQPIIHSPFSADYELWGICENGDVGHSSSGEFQIKEESKGKNFPPFLEGSSPQQKRRKVEHKIVDGLSSSPRLREKVSYTVNADSVYGNVENEEHNPKAILESQGLSISGEDAVKSIVRSPVGETHENEDHNIIERSGSSAKAQMKEGEISLGSGDRRANAPFTFMYEELEASFISSLMKQAAGHSPCCLMEETGAAHPTSIVIDAGGPCIEGSHVSFPLGDNLTLGDVERLPCAGRTMQEQRFDPAGTSKFSYFSVGSPHGKSLDLIDAYDAKPELEGFVLETDDKPTSIVGEEISLDDWNLPSNAIGRARILEQLCKSACMQTPVACSSASYKLHKIQNLYQSVPTGLLESVDASTTLPRNDAVKHLQDGHRCLSEEVGQDSYGRSNSDFLSNHSGQSGWDIKKPYTSPVGKLWDRTGSCNSSSGKRRSLNQELPCINEENENTDEVAHTILDGIVSEVVDSPMQRVPLAEITEIPNPPALVFKAEPFSDRLSLDSVNTEFCLTGTHKGFKQRLGIQNSSKKRYNKENSSIRGTNDIKRATGSLHNRFSKPKLSGKSSLRSPRLSRRDPKPNNIVSSMTSFIPLVQQKQAAAVVTGKRDIKVKALEAAETAKRVAEKKENERKRKKEALKLERSRMEQENMRQLELQKKKKEEERKKKEADVAEKKRQREEEDKKERERKKMRVEARRQQREHEDKLPAEKEERESKCQAIDGRGHGSKVSMDEAVHKKMEGGRGYGTSRNILETEPSTSRDSTNDARRESIAQEECCEALSNFGYKAQVLGNIDKAIVNENSVANTSQEQSYEISPYKESDDENEEDDDIIPNSKFVPSWSSKKCLALAVSCQNGADPGVIFPPESFCSISEVLSPRKLQPSYNEVH